MALTQRIPLQPNTTDQLVRVELGGNPYILRILWNERGGYFSLTVMTADEAPIVVNVKMVKDYPLVKRFKNTLLPAGELYFVQEKGKSARPTYADLETNFGLYYHERDGA